MMRLILPVFLIVSSGLLGGCSLFSPFKPVTSCVDTNGNGVSCATVESNLEYSMKKDEPAPVPAPSDVNKEENKEEKKEADGKAVVKEELPHSDLLVEKDELVRLMAELNIDGGMAKRPVMVPPASYRVLVLPYSDGDKFYSGRYLYITAGKPKWVSSGYVVSGNVYKAASPDALSGGAVETRGIGSEILEQEMPAIEPVRKEAAVKHKVNAHLLNCRDMPSMEGNAIAVFARDTVLDITDKSSDWWKVNFYDTECYVNSVFLYSEPVQ